MVGDADRLERLKDALQAPRKAHLRGSTYAYKGYRKTYNRAHSPNATPPIQTAAPIRILAHRGQLAQAPLARRAGSLSFTSAQSKKWATIRSSPAMIARPRRKVPIPGPGKGAKTRLAIAIVSPLTMKRTL